MKCLFQLMHGDTGQRSQVIELPREELATLLVALSHEDLENQFVLVLMEKPDGDNEEYTFSHAPLMRATTYCYFFNEEYALAQNQKQLFTEELKNEAL